MLGSTEGLASVADPRLAGILLEGRESLDAYWSSQVTLRITSRQISEKRRDYEAALQEEKAQTAELRNREQDLREAIGAISERKARTEKRLRELRAAERARILAQEAATAAGGTQRSYELGIARDDIVAQAVEPISKSAYRKLYREAASQYGFGEDWYILAAVGKVESDHGANMGPSTAGAMGPMQFLPSTWETAGVDGNGDGVANILDPRDAIPAAAGYLESGGAPQDWYARSSATTMQTGTSSRCSASLKATGAWTATTPSDRTSDPIPRAPSPRRKCADDRAVLCTLPKDLWRNLL